MLIGVGNRNYGLIGTDHGAHGTPDTGVSHTLLLANTNKGAVLIATFLLEDVKLWHPLASIGEINGLFGAYCSAVATEGASVFAVLDDPGQIGVT
jgi:hypothetical protein